MLTAGPGNSSFVPYPLYKYSSRTRIYIRADIRYESIYIFF